MEKVWNPSGKCMESIPHSMESIHQKYGIHPPFHGIHPPFHGIHLEFLQSTPHSMHSIWNNPGRVKYWTIKTSLKCIPIVSSLSIYICSLLYQQLCNGLTASIWCCQQYISIVSSLSFMSAPISISSFEMASWPPVDAAWSAFSYFPPWAFTSAPSLSASSKLPHGLYMMLPEVHFHTPLPVHLHLPVYLTLPSSFHMEWVDSMDSIWNGV